MSLKCVDLFHLKSFEHIELIAGKNGLDNIVTWVYINQDSSVKNWIHGGELVFLTGMEGVYEEELLLQICKECIEHMVSGIVILCSEHYINEIPESVISTANRKRMPLFKMPWDLKLVDVTKEIANAIVMSQHQEQIVSNFFQELLFSAVFSVHSIQTTASQSGIKLEGPTALMICRPHITQVEEMGMHYRLESVTTLVQRNIEEFFAVIKVPALTYIYMNEVIVYCNLTEELGIEELVSNIEVTVTELVKRMQDMKLYIGVSEVCSDIATIRNCYRQAQQSLSFSEKSREEVAISSFAKLGILRLVINEKDITAIQGYCYDVLKPLIDIDNAKSTEYIKTLRVYLNNNCSLVKSAEELFIHRNTMVYRVEKLKELLNTDFEDMNMKAECINVLKILDYYMFDTSKFI